MYRGLRDPMMGTVVQQAFCQAFKDNTGTDWVEIFVPPASPDLYNSPWPSIVIPPSQVFWLTDYYNEFFVNTGAILSLYYKAPPDVNGKRFIIARESDVAEDVRARFLVHELFIRTGRVADVSAIRGDFESSGFTMASYIARLT